MKNRTKQQRISDCPETCIPSPETVAKFQAAIGAVVGKWKIEILCLLLDGPRRFSDLRRNLPGITQHMLTAQLRALAGHGLLTRTAFAEIPMRVEYELTDAAVALLPVFRALHDWGEAYGAAPITKARGRTKPNLGGASAV